MLKDFTRISDFADGDKTATQLAEAEFEPDDYYHDSIKRAAQALVRLHAGDTFVYVTQYGSGATVWRSLKSDARVTVWSDGVITV